MSNLLTSLRFWLRFRTTEKKLLNLYTYLARLDYREPQQYTLLDGRPISISTMRGGPRIFMFPNYEILLKYSNQNKQLYIQVNSTGKYEDWKEVYRTGTQCIDGIWLGVLKSLMKHNPCVPNRKEGFA